ncbi:MAG: 3-keto-disaccharide hydrolase [Prosthecobacter sp.]
MPSLVRTLLPLFLTCFLLSSSATADEKGFTMLLDAQHTEGWKMSKGEEAKPRNGVLTSSRTAKDVGALVYTKKIYSDFILKLEYTVTNADSTSGVRIRMPAETAFSSSDGSSYKVLICGPRSSNGVTGTVTSFKTEKSFPPTTPPAQKEAGQWNEMEISAIGPQVTITVNGSVVNQFQASKASQGFVGISCRAGNPVQFRNIRVKEMTSALAASSPAASASTTLVIDPDQPLLESFSQLAPNASAWALVPLDDEVPPNVRQNLSYLREDLLDEHTHRPQASQETYKLAHQLCSIMIDALDERNQALVRAGFRAAQAEANANATLSENQSLNARRNYMMSWPQHAREQAQRAVLQTQAGSKSQVVKEQTKIDWSVRTVALHKTMDSLYAQFRGALRQSAVTK